MKKTTMALMTIMLASTVGTAFADEAVSIKENPMNNPDSLINYLDPANAPAPAAAGQRGSVVLITGPAVAGFHGNAGSLINDLDPGSARVAKIVTRTAKGSTRENPDSLVNDLDPSNAPRVNVVTRLGKVILH